MGNLEEIFLHRVVKWQGQKFCIVEASSSYPIEFGNAVEDMLLSGWKLVTVTPSTEVVKTRAYLLKE